MSRIGIRIKERRHEMGVSAEKLAALINKSPATIYRYEAGGIEKVPADILLTIATALNTTPAYLMGWTDDPNPYKASAVGMDNNKVIVIDENGQRFEFTLNAQQTRALLMFLDNMK